VIQLPGGRADSKSMLPLVLIGASFILGIALGRWWALLACVAVGLWVGTTEEVEVPGWVLGAGYGALSGIGVASGVMARRLLARPRH
jgi:hypothetical protein